MRFLLLGILFAASFATGAPAQTGKLVGHVDYGPVRPIEHPGEKHVIPPAVLKKLVVLVTQPGPHNNRMKSHMLRLVAQLKLTPNGDFSTTLTPGEYRVSITSDPPLMHAPAPQEIKIVAGKTTTVRIKVDTGIR